jgi:hypothetical protein
LRNAVFAVAADAHLGLLLAGGDVSGIGGRHAYGDCGEERSN